MQLPKDKHIILFDGVCNLCDSAVQLVIKNDTKDLYRFAALQSTIGQELLKTRGVHQNKVDSIVLIIPGQAYFFKADAALEIASNLKGGYKILGFLRKIIPSALSNVVYDFIAKNRYKWYGKKEACMIPTPELRAKFLD